MRWLLGTLCVATACSFSPGQASTTPGDAEGRQVSDARHDGATTAHDGPAAAIDAAPDAPSECVMHSTATYMGHHYFATGNKTWPGAVGDCSNNGGHLVKIETSGENSFVTNTFTDDDNNYTWIGLNDSAFAGIYVWTDLSGLGSYNAFHDGNPPGSQGCVASSGEWTVANCLLNLLPGTCECE